MNLDFENMTTDLVSHEILEKLKEYKKIIIYGAGDSGSWVFKLLTDSGLKITCFCDGNKDRWDEMKYGLPIISPDELISNHSDAAICLASIWKEEIKGSLLSMNPGIGESIFDLLTTMTWETTGKEFESGEPQFIRSNLSGFSDICKMLDDEKSKATLSGVLNYRLTRNESYLKEIKSNNEIYLDKEIINPGVFESEGIIIDGGAFTGDTLLSLVPWMDLDTSHYIAYEAGEENSIKFCETANGINGLRYECRKKALWNICGETLMFESAGLSGHVADNSGVPVLTETLDEVLSLDKEVVFIKLDIEGAERKAIEGGKELIKKYHPTLAICAYHLQDDLLVLPRMIKEIYAGYKLYLRHYLVGAGDTVLYAVG